MSTNKVGRNAPCPCGSGRKHKHCCAGETAERHERRISLTFTVALAVVGLASVAAVAGLLVRPDGVETPGRVWSAEHGHWHDAADNEIARRPLVGLAGDAPPGKVWSDAHGHWHDADGGEPAPLQSSAPPDGPAPEGKVWSHEHGHWHDAS